MAMIITLNRDCEAVQDTQSQGMNEERLQSDAAAPRGAEVIIFPGVRYERWDEQQSGQAARKRPSTRRGTERDWLHI